MKHCPRCNRVETDEGLKFCRVDFQWAPDGQALIYANTLSGVSNLWRQPLDGKPAKQITNFKSDLIYSFAYSHDGRDLALARGSHSRDTVLITEVK